MPHLLGQVDAKISEGKRGFEAQTDADQRHRSRDEVAGNFGRSGAGGSFGQINNLDGICWRLAFQIPEFKK